MIFDGAFDRSILRTTTGNNVFIFPALKVPILNKYCCYSADCLIDRLPIRENINLFLLFVKFTCLFKLTHYL